MGKSSSSSCWKIIACGGDSAVEDDIESQEAKGSIDKCGWRFRKRLARHRVLRNSVITANCTSPGNSAVSEKVVYFEQQDEKPQPEQQHEKPQPPQVDPKLPTSLESKMLETVEDPKSSASIKQESDETVDAQPELPISSETKVSGTVVELSPEPPASVEPDVHETMIASTTESQASAEPLISETVDASQEVDYNAVVEEPSVVVIQSGVRGFLAQSELSKLKSIIKLQAAIRGHLVRRHAVDTLHCFQGIVEFQSIVRGRQSNLLDGEVSANKPVKTQTSMEKLLSNAFARQLLESIPKSKSTTIKCDPMRPSLAWNWLERWMAAYSSELPDLQKPKTSAEEATKPTEEDSSQTEAGNMSKIISKSMNSDISFKDAPSLFLRSESSFKDAPSSFLRSESSFKDAPTLFLKLESCFKDAPSSFLSSKPSFKDAPSSFLNSGSGFKDARSMLNSDRSFKDAPSLLENEENSSSNAETDIPELLDLSLTREKMEYPSHSHDRTNQSFVEPLENVATQKDQSNQSDSTSPTESCSHSLSHKTSSGIEEPKICAKSSASASEKIDADGKQFVYGSRKASNPSFIAAQSKFEELSSAVNSGRSLSSPHVDNDIDSRVDADTASSSVMGSIPEGKDPGAVEIPGPDDLGVQIGGSECGTELSVTSTLDSPDRSEAGIGKVDLELKFMGGQVGDAISKKQSFEFETNDNYGLNNASDLSSCFSVQQKVDVCETNGESAKPAVAMDSALQIEEPKKVAPVEHANDKYVYSITSSDSSPPQVEEKPETNSSDKNQTRGSGVEHSAHQDSLPPMASSSSQTTVVESQETPCSQVSVKAKRSKIDKSGPHSPPRRSSVSAGKRSPSHNSTHDSSARSSSVDILAKDQKSGGKRRNPFGSTKLDNDVDQEPRDSTSSIRTLPSYMQATESARAKAHSPRSSPDMQENKDAYAKKRHSLSSATSRQGSPRVQRSSSQASQQRTKANGNTPTSEDKRRWVR